MPAVPIVAAVPKYIFATCPDVPLVVFPEIRREFIVPSVPKIPEVPDEPDVPLAPTPPPTDNAAVPATEDVPNPITRVLASDGVTESGEMRDPST